MATIQTAERVSREASDNFVFQRSLLAYHAAADRIAGDVLEIGTGAGYGIEVVAPRARRFVTLDKFAAGAAALPNVEFRQATVPPLPFPDGCFDCVISFQVIEHIERDRELVAEVRRVLRPGGRFILTTPNAPMSLTRNPWHVREYTAEELRGLLAEAFPAVEALGVFGNERVMAYYEQNRRSVRRITRFDLFDLQHRLPRRLLQLPYDLLNRLNRRRLLARNTDLTTSIRMEDYRLAPVADDCFDLFYIATRYPNPHPQKNASMNQTKPITIGGRFTVGGDSPLTLLGGTCVIEDEATTMRTAEAVQAIAARLGINYVYKSSFDKANRSSIASYRGPGLEKGLKILRKVKETFGLPIVTDVHEAWQCEPVAEVADILQIPAFLCRQTDLLLAAGKTGRAVNVKKAQFLAARDMGNAVRKIEEGTGNRNILLTERGTSFGYNNLVVDFTGLADLRKFGYPVVFDATHSVQKPGGLGETTGGAPEYIPTLLYAAAAVGIDAIFAEVHPDPARGLSDSTSMLPVDRLEAILAHTLEIDRITRGK